jgi:hypothetical protein
MTHLRDINRAECFEYMKWYPAAEEPVCCEKASQRTVRRPEWRESLPAYSARSPILGGALANLERLSRFGTN